MHIFNYSIGKCSVRYFKWNLYHDMNLTGSIKASQNHKNSFNIACIIMYVTIWFLLYIRNALPVLQKKNKIKMSLGKKVIMQSIPHISKVSFDSGLMNSLFKIVMYWFVIPIIKFLTVFYCSEVTIECILKQSDWMDGN